jgi:hypothetical protein
MNKFSSLDDPKDSDSLNSRVSKDREDEDPDKTSENGSVSTLEDDYVEGIRDIYTIEQLKNLVDTTRIIQYDPVCVRKKSNWSKTGEEFKMDDEKFNPKALLKEIKTRSPKLDRLLKNIEKLDRDDRKIHGHTFKHFIFSDLKSGAHGAKLIAAAFIAKRMRLGYVLDDSKIRLLEDAELLETANQNFLLLSSTEVFDKPIGVNLKKNILKKFNQRPENVYGELAQIIVMDSGFKEGIDLFDVKYVHLFEPSVSAADQTQTIGRATRTCGQKGLQFHPTRGWPLHVYQYDLEIGDAYQKAFQGSQSTMELYLKSLNIDLRRLNFAEDLEKLTIYGSVDYELNRPIHEFAISAEEEDTESNPESPVSINGGKPRKQSVSIVSLSSGDIIEPIHTSSLQKIDFDNMRTYVRDYFMDDQWETVKMENLCGYAGPEAPVSGGAGSQLINYTPTQRFIQDYFTPFHPLKGLLLYHSVGTGKTCSAIAAASANFEPEEYTVLWVTRTTLKSDIWKNMFDQICNDRIRMAVENGESIPEEQRKRVRLLSKSWKIRPMSYKQFSNLILKENQFYRELVKINGEEDPLRKTLLIIDEAHKLYEDSDLSVLERPNMEVLRNAIQNSYMVSGRNSVRLLLMTATPISANPMELIQLLNLMKMPDEQMSRRFEDFAEIYLDGDTGRFTAEGKKLYLDQIAGLVSCLNREKDARQFAQPIIRNIMVPMVSSELKSTIDQYDRKFVKEYLQNEVVDLKKKIETVNQKLEGDLGDLDLTKFAFLKKKCDPYQSNQKKQMKCLKIVNANIAELLKEAKKESQKIRDEINEIREQIKNANLFRNQVLSNIKDTVVADPEAFKEYKNTVYYQIRETCSKQKIDNENFDEVVEQHPAIQFINARIEDTDDLIQEKKEGLENRLTAYRNHLKQLRQLLRTDLSSMEKELVRLIIQYDRRAYQKTRKSGKKEVEEEVQELMKERKKIENGKKKMTRRIRRTLRSQLKEKQDIQRDLERAAKKLKRARRKQGEMESDIADELIQNLVNGFTENIDSELEGLQREMEEYEQKRAEKQALAEARREEKRQERLAKAAEQRAEKQRVQEEKKQARVEERRRKMEEKEQIRLTKKREREEKKALNKTRKNKK